MSLHSQHVTSHRTVAAELGNDFVPSCLVSAKSGEGQEEPKVSLSAVKKLTHFNVI